MTPSSSVATLAGQCPSEDQENKVPTLCTNENNENNKNENKNCVDLTKEVSIESR